MDCLKFAREKIEQESGNGMDVIILSSKRNSLRSGKKALASSCGETCARVTLKGLLLFHDLPFNSSQLRSHLPFLPTLSVGWKLLLFEST